MYARERQERADAPAIDQSPLERRAARAAERQRARAGAGRRERSGDLAHVEEDREPADADRQATDERRDHDGGDARRTHDAPVDPHGTSIAGAGCLLLCRAVRTTALTALAGAALAIGLAAPAAEAANPWIKPRPLNIAHQGGEDEFPSNTMFAFRQAVKAGADMLELDIGVTKDNKVVVMHDTTVDGKTNGRGTVASTTLRQIRKLDAAYWFSRRGPDRYEHGRPRSAYPFRGVATGARKPPKGFSASDFRAPTLSEVMKAFPRTPINVEIKGRTPDEADAEQVATGIGLISATFGIGGGGGLVLSGLIV